MLYLYYRQIKPTSTTIDLQLLIWEFAKILKLGEGNPSLKPQDSKSHPCWTTRVRLGNPIALKNNPSQCSICRGGGGYPPFVASQPPSSH